jgi:hypothetical protein
VSPLASLWAATSLVEDGELMATVPSDNELAYHTAGGLVGALAQKRVSAVELVDAALARSADRPHR